MYVCFSRIFFYEHSVQRMLTRPTGQQTEWQRKSCSPTAATLEAVTSAHTHTYAHMHIGWLKSIGQWTLAGPTVWPIFYESGTLCDSWSEAIAIVVRCQLQRSLLWLLFLAFFSWFVWDLSSFFFLQLFLFSSFLRFGIIAAVASLVVVVTITGVVHLLYVVCW